MLKSLNPVQREAVEHTDGPSLILAGAGSGKTKVLTHKIAYLIERKKVAPTEILALTFTNKAAREMKNRISQLIKHQSDTLWCSTFHSFLARLLRREGEKLGFKTDFVIYDENDQAALIKLIIDELKLGHENITAKAIQSKISQLKNKLVHADEFKTIADGYFEEFVAQIYPLYQGRLLKSNAMDFDDLLLKPIGLFEKYPEVLSFYQNRWRYLLVDEYQDTNYPQYLILKMLSAKHQNLTVVGDDDQSIYRWRGAEIRNILEFQQDFPGCKIFRLEQNYRSTANILTIANSIIINNAYRMGKELWTKKEDGEQVTLLVNDTGDEEALRIVAKIQEEFHNYKRNFSDFAILYRTNAQSRALEDGLRRNGIAYIIVGGIRFFERKEIKDMLAYLRVVCNPLDEISLKRVINFPLRGIGNTTVEKIDRFCLQKNLPFIEGLRLVREIEGITDRTRAKIDEFYQLIVKYQNLKNSISAIELATTLIEEIGILQALKEEGTEEALSRRENIQELFTQISQFCRERNEPTLSHFLEEISLISDIDRWDERANAVTLMTMHAAKGLEFPVVFIAGIEDGMLPLARNSETADELEEERRLFYVGITRAREKLYLSFATNRMRYGEVFSGNRSRFLDEIEENLLAIDDSPVYQPRATRQLRERNYEEKPITVPLPKSEKKSLKKGALVRHPRFGRGVVRWLEGDGADMRATIIFEGIGEKKLVIQFAKLEIL